MSQSHHVRPLNPCPACATEVDDSAHPPFARIACPACGESMWVRGVFRHYEVQQEIGKGGMSRVFLAYDSTLDRHVALKVLLDRFSHDDDRVRQLEKEAQITASFTHPNVVKVYAVGQAEHHVVIVMELVENGSLDEWIAAHGTVSEQQAIAWTLEVARGLQAAYQNGLIHRDVKPGNILLTKERSAKLVDFGLALMYNREVDDSEDIWATPYYVSPEKLLGKGEDHRSDIYSLGATLYHLLAGKPSFEVVSGSFEELRAAKLKPVHLREAAPHVSAPTAQLVEAMMASDPSKRPASYDALIARLEALRPGRRNRRSGFARSSGSAAQQFLAKQAVKKHQARRRALVTASICTVLVLAGIAAVFHQSQTQDAPRPSVERPPTPPVLDEAPVLPPAAPPLASLAFSEGRKALIEGQWAEAQASFRDLRTQPDAAHTLKTWARFHEGLAQLFTGKERLARGTFEAVRQDSLPSILLAGVFAEACGHLSQDRPVPSTVVASTPQGSCQPIFLLAYGLKNWALGAFNQAEPHLQAFRERWPSEEYLWITEYHPLIDRHLADLPSLTSRPPLGSLTEPSALRQELNALARIEPALQTSRARKWLRARRGILKKRLAEGGPPAPSGETDEPDRWKALQRKLEPLAAAARFEEGLALLDQESGDFQEAATREAAADLLHIWKQAHTFLDELFQAHTGITSLWQRRDGETLQGQLKAVAKGEVTLETATGPVSIATTALAPEALARFAEARLESTRDANLYYHSQETLVWFALLTRLDDVLQRQLPLLTQENRSFRQRWRRIQAWAPSLSTTLPKHHG